MNRQVDKKWPNVHSFLVEAHDHNETAVNKVVQPAIDLTSRLHPSFLFDFYIPIGVFGRGFEERIVHLDIAGLS